MGVLIIMLFVFGVLGALGAALTLPGLAGLVLTIGAAIDGNVISFERVREELREGKSLRVAMKRGFGLSVSAIVDANLTSLLVAGALYQYTTGAVRGFAVTLAIGIVAAMFVNLVVVPWALTLITGNRQRSFMRLGKDIRGLEFVRRAAPSWRPPPGGGFSLRGHRRAEAHTDSRRQQHLSTPGQHTRRRLKYHHLKTGDGMAAIVGSGRHSSTGPGGPEQDHRHGPVRAGARP